MSLRTLNDKERKIIDRLLQGDFPGRDQIHEQVKNSKVEVIDSDGSLKFHLKNKGVEKAPVEFVIPVEARGKDCDGIGISLLLHVYDGLLIELEIFRDDEKNVICLDVLSLETFCNQESKGI